MRMAGFEQVPVGPDEGFVVEACTEETAEEVETAFHVAAGGGPGVDGAGLHAVFEVGGRGEAVGQFGAVQRDVHDGVRLVHPGAPDAARAVVFETATHHLDAIGEEGGGEGVAFEPLCRTCRRR